MKVLGSFLESQSEIVQRAFQAWQQEARTYIAWRNSEKGEQMHQYRDILKLEPVQERMGHIKPKSRFAKPRSRWPDREGPGGFTGIEADGDQVE